MWFHVISKSHMHELLQIDMDELRTILTELDGKPPLPKDLL